MYCDMYLPVWQSVAPLVLVHSRQWLLRFAAPNTAVHAFRHAAPRLRVTASPPLRVTATPHATPFPHRRVPPCREISQRFNQENTFCWKTPVVKMVVYPCREGSRQICLNDFLLQERRFASEAREREEQGISADGIRQGISADFVICIRTHTHTKHTQIQTHTRRETHTRKRGMYALGRVNDRVIQCIIRMHA